MPQVAPTRLPAGTEIRVDGLFDEEVWKDAAVLGSLTQVVPVEGAAPSRPTEVRLAYDADFIYLGITCFDEPEEVRARQRDRDANVQFDDVVQFWFDTFHDKRFAFWFQVTAAGSRGDALLADGGTSFNKDWDGIWYGRSQVTDRGWQAEVALPFKTLAFATGESTWGFNFQRERVADGNESRWASPHVAYRFWNLAEGGELIGLEGMDQGYGLDITPYAKAGVGRDRSEDPGAGFEEDFDAGLDLSWRPTASSTLRLTVNTDFAETEVDELQVNLSRFPLFFPEKREFFLEDAGVFNFGFPGGRRSRPNLVPFFSRTIGRDDDGQAVRILAGGKFTGRVGNWNIGVLDTYVDGFEGDNGPVERKNLSVVRASRNMGEQSSAGVIFTNGRPEENGDAYTMGADFRVGSSRLFGEGHSGTMWGYYLKTGADGPDGEGQSFGLRAQATSGMWDNTLEAFRIEEGFDPAMGFVRRTGIDRYRMSSQYTWRGGDGDALRQVQSRVSPTVTLDLDGREDRWIVPMRWFELELPSEDSLSFETRREFERLEDGFDLSDDVFVVPGEYYMTRHVVRLETNNRRLVKSELSFEWGDFFSGDITRLRFEPVILPSALFTWRLNFQDIRADLEEGEFNTVVVGTNFDFSFSPDLSWKNLVQYDTESENLGWQSRMHWIVTPGQDLFLVGLFGWDRLGREAFASTNAELTLKVTYTWRF